MSDPVDIERLRQGLRFKDRLAGREFHFQTTWGLFSPRGIDEGTRLLVDLMEVPADADCVDLGCGYGAIGLAMAAQAPGGRTLMLDKDFVAVDHARANARLNRLGNAEALLSNGFGQVPPGRRFDLVASNIPAKVGRELLTLLLYDARARLRPGGAIYVVSINGLRQFLRRNLQDIFGDYKKLKQGRTYTVARAHRGGA